MLAIVDAGPLYASVDGDDVNHERSVEVLQRTDLELVVPALVVTEVCYMIGERLGARIEAEFLRGLSELETETPTGSDWSSMADLVVKYADFPLGGVDASVAVLADRLGTDVIITLDQRHFRTLRTPSGGAYRLLPE